MSNPKPAWHVQIDGQIYGPYTDELMKSYISEGRIVGTSMVTPDPTRGYYAAERFPVFKQLLDQRAAAKPAIETPRQVVSRPGYQQASPAQDMQSYETPQSNPGQVVATALRNPVDTDHTETQVQMRPQTQIALETAVQHKKTVFLVMAEIRSGQTMAFLQALQNNGVTQRIGDNLWLVRGATTAQLLRNILSQTLTRQDRLFILDSFANQTAWFNIGAEMDTKIRDLWALD